MNNDQLNIDYLTTFFLSAGYKKSGRTWYKKKDDIVILCNFQKSSYSDHFYLNFGICFIDLLKTKKIPPPEHACHWGARYEKFMEKIKINFTTDIVSGAPKANIRALEIITQNIQSYIIPVLDKFSDYNFLKNLTIEDFETTTMQLRHIKWEDFIIFLKNK